MTAERITTDLLVIGAGSGGLSAAAGAVQMGARVVLLEGGAMGGDCLNHGCIPSKALIASGAAAHAQAHSAVFGVADAAAKVDYAAAKDHVAEVIARIAPHDSVERFERLGVRVIREYGTFISPTEVRAGDKVIRARRSVIATGSAPLVPPIPGLETVPYHTNETIFALRERPAHLLIVGGGPVGMEMAQAHARLGSHVTVIEGDRALGRDDPEMAATVCDSLRAEGVEIAQRAVAAQIRATDGGVEVQAEDGRRFGGTHLLVAVGRRPNTGRLDLEAAGIEATSAGIRVDAGLRTTNRRVYAIGDVTGQMPFTHVAGYHASVILRSALFGLPAKAATAHLPRATYTDPELAQIGLTEQEARRRFGDRVEVARADYAGNDRAVAQRDTRGGIKLMVVRGRPVGVSIVGPHAAEQAGLWSLAIANRMKMGQIAAMVAPYPTLSEINKRAAGAYFSPRLFDKPLIKTVVGLVQRWLP
ncbi:FAD-dependent oxidoreductase [Roseovarius salis]|uniref:dihydrolipoyl dehydrogenase family protein n=1 Tax=Roseovarius salis TaxID=3376063 RepID=UPI0037C68305